MLTHLHIQNFAIVDRLALDFNCGMTTITGETGAGKSIAIDALGLCLGDRADAAMVRPNQDKAEIVAVFNLQHNLSAQQWLKQHELLEGDECILRRVITTEGRSRAYINGSPVPASQQKSLGQHLINIHGQHAHQLLMRPEHQLILLDNYAGHRELLQHMAASHQQWRETRDQLRQQQQMREAQEAQKQLLEYQINELNELNLAENEYPELEQEHKKLSNCGDIASASQSVLLALSEDEQSNALHLLRHAQHELVSLAELDPHFSELRQMVEEACIQVQEASSEIANYAERLEMDPARLHYLDQRMSSIMRLARKHQVTAAELYSTHQAMICEYSSLQDSDANISELTLKLEQQYQACLAAAENLSHSRQQYATELDALISASMHELSMPHGQFHIALSPQPANLSALGSDKIDFQVSTNPGQPMQGLAKVASGGELSRISLAIQVITAQKVETPSLIFDEVDVGISGPTAAIVGKMLRKLGESTQVMCVTHLPQVAGSGHQQMFVAKCTKQGQTFTSMRLLNLTERVQELARLLAGSEITERTLANAKELLHPADLSAEELLC